MHTSPTLFLVRTCGMNETKAVAATLRDGIRSCLMPVYFLWTYYGSPQLNQLQYFVRRKLGVFRRTKTSLRNLRYLIVKQEVLAMLYCAPAEATSREILFSSLKHSGPVGLLSRAKAQMRIVKEHPSPECLLWRQIALAVKLDLSELESLKTRPFRDGARGHSTAPGDYAVDVTSLPYDAIDVVLSFDIAIPASITRAHPNILFIAAPPELGAPYFKSLSRKMDYGYDLLLTQRTRWNTPLRRHHLEASINFQYPGVYEEIVLEAGETVERDRIFVEAHCYNSLSDSERAALEAILPVETVSARTEDIIRALLRSKYFVQFTGRRLRGNALVEASAAGCLVLSNPSTVINRQFILPGTRVRTFQDIITSLRRFEADDSMFAAELESQREIVEYLNYFRPLQKIEAEYFRKVAAAKKVL